MTLGDLYKQGDLKHVNSSNSPVFSSSSFFSSLGVQRWQFISTLFCEKLPGNEGAYCDGQCFTVGLCTFPVRVRTAANISQEFLGNRCEVYSLDAGASAYNCLGSNIVSSLSTGARKPSAIYISLVYVLILSLEVSGPSSPSFERLYLEAAVVLTLNCMMGGQLGVPWFNS